MAHEVSRLEEALSNSNEKIADLLKVKEKYAELLSEKLNQTITINELEEQVIQMVYLILEGSPKTLD
jgi:hypothetical protein